MSQENKEKKVAEEEMHARIIQQLDPILNAQLNLAKGVSYLYRIDEIGKGDRKRKDHVLVTDPTEIKEALDMIEEGDIGGDNPYYYITTKPPDGKAIENLVDRVFGKPRQSMEIDNPKQNVELEQIRSTLKNILIHERAAREGNQAVS